MREGFSLVQQKPSLPLYNPQKGPHPSVARPSSLRDLGVTSRTPATPAITHLPVGLGEQMLPHPAIFCARQCSLTQRHGDTNNPYSRVFVLVDLKLLHAHQQPPTIAPVLLPRLQRTNFLSLTAFVMDRDTIPHSKLILRAEMRHDLLCLVWKWK